ncbi:MAG: hypothetical protein L3J47_00595 [Sulfurovum sp.]|nr:hypothetical protein [Sulfurovum sp.]
MTHRVFSRNAASSRAIPIEKMIKQVEDSPVMPLYWGSNKSGMQATEELKGTGLYAATLAWLKGRDQAVLAAKEMLEAGAHKQIVNRLLEPWMFITVILTATEFENWYKLRDSEFAQPEIAWVAREMRKAQEKSEPESLRLGEWHLPYIELENTNSPLYLDIGSIPNADSIVKIATARCARVSYLCHDGKRDYTKDIALHDRCRDLGHWSAFEHCAKATTSNKQVGNFRGWKQYRKTFQGESGVKV